VQQAFTNALKQVLETRPMPLNASLINDTMRRQDPSWQCQKDLGCSFAMLCQAFVRDRILEIRKEKETNYVVASKLAPAVPPPKPPPRERDGGKDRKERKKRRDRRRSKSPAGRGSQSPVARGRSPTPKRHRSASPVSEGAPIETELWDLS
jgi:hypothetical protein